MKVISIREAFDYINISENNEKNSLNSKQIKALEKYIKQEKLNMDFFLWERERFRIINYCGFISFADVTIEILPKTQSDNLNSTGYERKALVNMLRESRFIDINYSSLSLLNLEKDNLLEIFAFLFSEKLKSELIRGIYKEYINQEEDLSILKGKLNLKNQIKNISKRNGKVNCSFSSFEEDNLLNSCFYTFSRFLVKKVKSIRTQENLKFINLTFADVSLINLEKSTLKKVIFNRNNKRFYEAFVLLKKLFFSTSSLGKNGDDHGFSLLFEVNTLYEAYIGKIIQKDFPHLNVKLQDTSKRLLINSKTDRGIFQLIPDIVMDKIIIDTKWKLLNNSNRHGVCRDDLYQMYAYATRYKEVERVILLYPLASPDYTNGEILENWHIEEQENKKIQVVTIDYSSKDKTVEGLKNLINKGESYV